MDGTLYFDDAEEGLSRETSHPFFVEHATADFYYDEHDAFAPFGNDAGNSTLRELEEWYQERRAGEKSVSWFRRQTVAWGFSTDYLDCVTEHQLTALDRKEQYLNDTLDQSIFATVLGQYKIAGQADKAMLAMAVVAFRRQRYFTGIANPPDNPWQEAELYLNRLSIMEADLAAMANKKAR